MHCKKIPALFAAFLLAVTVSPTHAQEPVPPERIHFIHMGGDDCPPCKAWRLSELPKLKESPVFSKITFSYVRKTIQSPVPATFFLPEEVKPLKDKLDYASGGRIGSPQQVIVVDGEVFDYWFGARNANQIEQALVSLVEGTNYPYRRCVKWTAEGNRSCEIKMP